MRPVGKMKKLPSNVNVCYLYQPGGLERGRQRATDPIWSLHMHMHSLHIYKMGTLYLSDMKKHSIFTRLKVIDHPKNGDWIM